MCVCVCVCVLIQFYTNAYLHETFQKSKIFKSLSAILIIYPFSFFKINNRNFFLSKQLYKKILFIDAII